METKSGRDRTVRIAFVGINPVMESADLFAGDREVAIKHGEELYRLRLTSSNKLILIK